jgi:hypothetical protein
MASARGAYLLRGSGATDPMNLNWVMPAKGSGTQGTLMMAAPHQGERPFACALGMSADLEVKDLYGGDST